MQIKIKVRCYFFRYQIGKNAYYRKDVLNSLFVGLQSGCLLEGRLTTAITNYKIPFDLAVLLLEN